MTDKTVVISARVPVEVANRLREQDIRKILTEASEGMISQINEIPPEILDDLRVMAALSGGTFKTLVCDLHKKLDRGNLELEHGKIITNVIDVRPFALYLNEFMAACRQKNKDIGEMLNNGTRAIMRGQW